jgi:hypothetical protein
VLALELVERQFCAGLRRVGTAQAYVDADGIPGGSPRECADLFGGWTRRNEFAARTTEFIPLHQGCLASGFSRGSRLRPFTFKQGVKFAEGGIERTKSRANEETVRDRPEQQACRKHADDICNPFSE